MMNDLQAVHEHKDEMLRQAECTVRVRCIDERLIVSLNNDAHTCTNTILKVMVRHSRKQESS